MKSVHTRHAVDVAENRATSTTTRSTSTTTTGLTSVTTASSGISCEDSSDTIDDNDILCAAEEITTSCPTTITTTMITTASNTAIATMPSLYGSEAKRLSHTISELSSTVSRVSHSATTLKTTSNASTLALRPPVPSTPPPALSSKRRQKPKSPPNAPFTSAPLSTTGKSLSNSKSPPSSDV